MAWTINFAAVLIVEVLFDSGVLAASVTGIPSQLACVAHVRNADINVALELIESADTTVESWKVRTPRASAINNDDDEVLHNPPDGRYLKAASAVVEPPRSLFSEPNGSLLFERCLVGHVCQTVWTMERHANNTTDIVGIEFAGCFPVMEGTCATNSCISHLHRVPPGRPNLRTQSCCCNTLFCNRNYTSGPEPVAAAVMPVNGGATSATAGGLGAQEIALPNSTNNFNTYLVWAILAVVTGLVVGGSLFLAHRWYHKKQKPQPDTGEKGQMELNLSEAFPGRIYSDKTPLLAANVEMGDKLAFGHYGQVYRAKVDSQVVAVKKFAPLNRDFFLHECRIYSLPHMEHEAVLKFLAATELRDYGTGLISEYWLVVEYHPNRTLTEYLKQNTIDSFTLVDMALSLASGLSHLHSEITRDGVSKPGIVHRDLNSRNILVREDLGLCICDMGLALTLDVKSESQEVSQSGSSSSGSKRDEPPPLNDVGTVRYMAPEVLEGSLNLRDSSAALRQVDMYAFALVLWEMATRCWDIYQDGVPVPEYQLPFQKEAGLKPTFQLMQNLVARKKVRPLFCGWKKGLSTVRFLEETMEECWDGDAEARLTANCVRERLIELSSNLGPHRIYNKLDSVSLAPPSLAAVLFPTSEHVEEASEVASLLADIDEHIRPPVKNVNQLRAEGALNTMPMPYRVQPHQGRNPCVERNMKPESSEELTCSGNNLIGKRSASRKKPSASSELNPAGRRSHPTGTASAEHASHVLGGDNRCVKMDVAKGRQRKVPNSLAAQQNRNGFFSFFRKNNDSSNLLKYRAAAQPLTAGGGVMVSGPLDSAGKCNIQAAAKLGRGGGGRRRDAAHESSNTTQLTCLSPSPSTSGASPPRPVGVLRQPRFPGLPDNETAIANLNQSEDSQDTGGAAVPSLSHPLNSLVSVVIDIPPTDHPL